MGYLGYLSLAIMLGELPRSLGRSFDGASCNMSRQSHVHRILAMIPDAAFSSTSFSLALLLPPSFFSAHLLPLRIDCVRCCWPWFQGVVYAHSFSALRRCMRLFGALARLLYEINRDGACQGFCHTRALDR